jgi:hypothetical protein
MKNSKIRLFFGVLVVTAVLSSCISMTSHLLTVRKQLCEFDENFSVVLDRGVEVKLHEPVLRDSEVFLMVGAPPTTKVITADGMTASYVFEQLLTTNEHLDKGSESFFEKGSDPFAVCNCSKT